jgi:endonuclease-3
MRKEKGKDGVRARVGKIIDVLTRLYPDAETTLDYKKPHQLLISTMLAAQATDKKVNEVTKSLYKKYRSVEDFARADLEELEKDIRPLGFFRNKAKNIKAACTMLFNEFGSKVPDSIEDMLKLPGVGRKTANVVLGEIYGIPGIIVDTHCGRLSNRIGLTKSKNPEIIERELMEVVPREKWNLFCHQLVFHGRAVCNARKPACGRCEIIRYCDYGRARRI